MDNPIVRLSFTNRLALHHSTTITGAPSGSDTENSFSNFRTSPRTPTVPSFVSRKHSLYPQRATVAVWLGVESGTIRTPVRRVFLLSPPPGTALSVTVSVASPWASVSDFYVDQLIHRLTVCRWLCLFVKQTSTQRWRCSLIQHERCELLKLNTEGRTKHFSLSIQLSQLDSSLIHQSCLAVCWAR